MIARILVKPFGSIWQLKEICSREKSFFSKIIKFLYHWYQYEHGSAISYKATFKTIPKLPNGTKQIVITQDVQIGANCTIYQQVSIQEEIQKDSKIYASPTIGDNCCIYPGVKIIGAVSIGDNVTIESNAVVDMDVPSNSIVKTVASVVIKNG